MFPGRLCVLVCFKAVLALATDIEAAETIAGRVRDASGAAIAKADIVLATPELTVIAASVSDAQGSFSMPAPAPGSYLLIARAPAFGETRQAVTVLAGKTAPIEIVLEVGPLEEEVTVAATRDSVDALRVSAQPVNVITDDEIAARVKTVVAQAVEGETGVHLQQTSPTMAGIFVRGLTGNKVNVFVDGVRYSNGAQRGGVNTFLDLIEPDGLETIEVLRGPSSAQYGSDALGGSIQFFSKPPTLGVTGGPRWRGTLTCLRRQQLSLWVRIRRNRLHRAIARCDRDVERAPGGLDPSRWRDRLACGGDALSRALLRRADGCAAARYRLLAVRRRRPRQLEARFPHEPGGELHPHGTGRREAIRPAARR